MKIKIDIECSPDEARQLMGLPDVKPLQSAVLAQIERQTLDVAKKYAPDALLQTWLSFAPQGTDIMQSLLKGVFSGNSATTKSE